MALFTLEMRCAHLCPANRPDAPLNLARGFLGTINGSRLISTALITLFGRCNASRMPLDRLRRAMGVKLVSGSRLRMFLYMYARTSVCMYGVVGE